MSARLESYPPDMGDPDDEEEDFDDDDDEDADDDEDEEEEEEEGTWHVRESRRLS